MRRLGAEEIMARRVPNAPRKLIYSDRPVEEVVSLLFSDETIHDCIRSLENEKDKDFYVSSIDLSVFNFHLREAAYFYIGSVRESSSHRVRFEIEELVQAAAAALPSRNMVVAALKDLSPETIALLAYRSRSLKIELPKIVEFDDPTQLLELCSHIVRLGTIGAVVIHGRKRSNGHRSKSLHRNLFAPEVTSAVSKRLFEQVFIDRLRVAWKYGVGKDAPRTSAKGKRNQFAEFAQFCFDQMVSGVTAVEVMNAPVFAQRPDGEQPVKTVAEQGD